MFDQRQRFLVEEIAKRLESGYAFYITKHVKKKLQGVFIK